MNGKRRAERDDIDVPFLKPVNRCVIHDLFAFSSSRVECVGGRKEMPTRTKRKRCARAQRYSFLEGKIAALCTRRIAVFVRSVPRI